jgi:hypothetical protein
VRVPFEYLSHLVVVPVTLNGVERRFILDSGIGVTCVRATLAHELPLEPAGRSCTGKRMSGQTVDIPLFRGAELTLAGHTPDVEVAAWDMNGLPPELDHIAGFVSLGFFEETPFAVDYPARELAVGERGGGTELQLHVERDGAAVTAFLPLTIPGGRSISVELDMGSDVLILDDRFAPEVGADLDAPDVRRVDGVDETGHPYTRRFTRIRGDVHPTGAPELAQRDPEVQFQSIVHDGLLGDRYLRRYVVTWDVAAATLSLA